MRPGSTSKIGGWHPQQRATSTGNSARTRSLAEVAAPLAVREKPPGALISLSPLPRRRTPVSRRLCCIIVRMPTIARRTRLRGCPTSVVALCVSSDYITLTPSTVFPYTVLTAVVGKLLQCNTDKALIENSQFPPTRLQSTLPIR